MGSNTSAIFAWQRLGWAAGLIALTAGYAVAAGFAPDWYNASTVLLAATVLLALLLMALSLFDLALLRLPDPLTAALLIAGLGIGWLADRGGLALQLAAAAAGYGAMRFVAFCYLRQTGRHGLGLGDAKLLGAAGAWIGLEGLPSVVMWASLIALTIVAASRVIGWQVDNGQRIPFGPFLGFAIWLVWLYGPIGW